MPPNQNKGNRKLTRRELEVMAYAQEGLSAPKIARLLERSPRTIENHIRSIYLKLGLHNRVDLLKAAQKLGLTEKVVTTESPVTSATESAAAANQGGEPDCSRMERHSEAFDILVRIDRALARVDTDAYPLALVRTMSANLQTRWAGLSYASSPLAPFCFHVCTDRSVPITQRECRDMHIPCGTIVLHDRVVCSEGMQKKFPQWQLGRELGVESYAGIRLDDRLLGTVGTLCVFDDKPMPHAEMCIEILMHYARRTAAELAITRTIDDVAASVHAHENTDSIQIDMN